MLIQTIRKNVIYLVAAVVIFSFFNGGVFAQEESYEVAGGDDGTGNVSATENENVVESHTIDGNHVSFDASVPAGSVVIDTPNYNASFNTWGDTSSGVSVTGPEGTTAQVTHNADGTYHVSFNSPSNTDVQFSDISFTPDDNQNFDVSQGGSISFNPVEDFPDWKCDGCQPPVLTAVAGCDGSQPVVNLAWNTIPGIPYGSHDLGSIYQIFRDPGFNLLPYYNSNGTIAKWNNGWDSNPGFYQDRAVSPNTIYFYRVFGSDGDINVGYNSEVQGSVTTVNYSKRTPVSNVMAVHTLSCDGSNTPPAPFTLSSPSPSCPASSPQVSLSWTESTRAVSYTIYMRDLADGVEKPVAVRGAGERSFVLDGSRGIEAGHSYGFVIAAKNSSGMVTYSNNAVWTDVGYGGTSVVCGAQPTPTPTGTLSLSSNGCISGGGSVARFNLSSPSSGVVAYHLDKDGVYIGTGSPVSTTLIGSLAAGQTATFTTRVQTAAGVFPGAGSISVSAANCVPTVRPIVNLTITTSKGTFPYGGLPVIVKQGESATINWQVEFADSATAFANPGRLDWAGAKNKVFGSQAISTTVEGKYVLGLSADNVVGNTSASIQLNILRLPAYIQTTGGDIHTNEDIFITPN